MLTDCQSLGNGTGFHVFGIGICCGQCSALSMQMPSLGSLKNTYTATVDLLMIVRFNTTLSRSASLPRRFQICG